MCTFSWKRYTAKAISLVVSIEFSPLSTVELTINWYQLHNGDYKGILVLQTDSSSRPYQFDRPVLSWEGND